MSPEDELHGPPLSFSSIREDVSLSSGDLATSHELGSKLRSGIHRGTPEADNNCHGDVVHGRSPFLKRLMDAEVAANSAVIQLMSFKDAIKDEVLDSRQSAVDKHRMTRQRALLLEKLEDFRRTNKSVRQTLKQLQNTEAARIDAASQTDILLKKISQAESENEHLKKELRDTERKVEQLTDLQREEQENIKTAVHMTKSVEATRARLLGQLRNKEAENHRLTVQLRTLERTLTEQKMKIDDLKESIVSLSQKEAHDKESLKKATRAQKQRAQRFEAAIEKCYAQLREKDALLANAHLERDSSRRQQEQAMEEKDKLIVHAEFLKSHIAEMTARLQREKDELTAANEIVMQQVEKVIAENGDLSVNNATLKASVAQLEQQLADCESVLIEEKVVSQERNHEVTECQHQVSELQAELNDVRQKYANLLRETEKTQHGKDAEVTKARQELQGRVDELKSYPDLLRAAEQSLFECQDSLRRSERKCLEKSDSIRQLQVKMERDTKLLRSSMEMKESIHEANLQLHEKIHSSERKMDVLQQENLELVRRLAAQEESLSFSNRQVDQRSSECQALNRQLEAALSDVKQQVNKVKDLAAAREDALQTKILELEAEKSRGEKELRLLRESKLSGEKQFEVRLKDLQLSLDQSESHKQSIQNYIDFLKNSYKAMFDDGPQTTTLGSSYFLK